MTSKKFYITTAIDYVNSLPHIGTAYEKIGADALARFMRMEGYEVHFQMGNDEHSANVQKSAQEAKLTPKIYCDEMRTKFTDIWQKLRISNDDFIQTSEARHHESAKKFFENVYKNGDIYEGVYKGWYCESCEAYQTEKDLVDGLCPNHKQKPKWLEEKNYFFKLSKYGEALLKHIESHPEFILPEIRRNEILSLLKQQGLQDISISRSTFTWGIPVPANPDHVIYVWFDALINYLTAVGYASDEEKFKKWWPAQVHIVGKDITRFHCVIWPAMLMSAGLALPETVFGHGFVYLKGEKMSKTLGNVVTPLDIIDQSHGERFAFDADVLRYYLLRGSSFGSDGNFTWDEFVTRYNSDLANDIGNLLSRTLGMAKKYFEGKVAVGEAGEGDQALQEKAVEISKKVREAFDYKKGDLAFHQALSSIWELIAACDKYIDSTAPWTLKKNNQDARLSQVLHNLVNCLRIIALWVTPFMPKTSERIFDQLKINPYKTFAEGEAWHLMPQSQQLGESTPLFPRIDLSKTA